MAGRKTTEAQLAARRSRLAVLWLQAARDRSGGTIRALAAQLTADGHPCSRETVRRDMDVITAEWRAERIDLVDEARVGLLAELRAARRLAWSARDYNAIGRLLECEARLLGLNAPDRLAVSMDPWQGLDTDRLDQLGEAADRALIEVLVPDLVRANGDPST